MSFLLKRHIKDNIRIHDINTTWRGNADAIIQKHGLCVMQYLIHRFSCKIEIDLALGGTKINAEYKYMA